MNLYFRVAVVALAALRAPALGPLGTSRLQLRTGPGDLDLNGHMNNGRYLSLMDLGRVDLSVRTGIHRTLLAWRCKPVVCSVMIRFRRSLLLGDRFELSTRMLGWDQRSVYMEHRVDRNGDTCSLALVRGAFTSPEGLVPPERLARAIGYDGPPPSLPDALSAWRDAEQDLLAVRKAG